MIYRFADVAFDPATGEVRSGAAEVQLPKQSHRLLQTLIEARDRVVSKGELRDKVWGVEVVSDEAIHTAVSSLRRSLAQVSPTPAWIKTVHRAGYRFVLEVEIEGASAHGGVQRPFVGRNHELESLRTVLDAAADARLRLSILSGEAGIGKTRTAREVASRAEAAGFLVLEGLGSEAHETSSLAPWISMLRDARALLGERSWGRLLASGTLERIDPLLDGRIQGEEEPGDGVQTVGLFDDLSRAILGLAESRSLLLLLDDLHRYDAPSLRLLERVLRVAAGSRTAIIGTVRSEWLEEPTSERALLRRVVRDATRIPTGRLIPLGALSAPEIEALIEAESGRSPEDAEARLLFERSEGNPLYALELLHHAMRAGGTQLTWDPAHVPPTLKGIVDRRLAALSAATRENLGAASVLGRRFDPVLVAAITGAPIARVQDAFVSARDARLLEPTDGDLGPRAFSHILVRDVIYALLGAERRAQLHLAVAQALERERSSVEATVEIARHRTLAAPHGDLERAVESCARAARVLSRRRFAFEQAARQMRNVERLLELLGHGNSPERREHRLLLAEAEHLAGHSHAAACIYLGIIEDARDENDVDRLARATLGLFDPYYLGRHSDRWDSDRRRWIGLARDAIEMLSREEHPVLLIRLESRLSLQLLREHRRDEAAHISHSARRAARALGDPSVLAEVLADSHPEMVASGRQAQLEDLAGEGLRTATAIGSRPLAQRFRLYLLDAALASGDPERIRLGADRGITSSDALGTLESRRAHIMWAIFEGKLELAQGQLDDLLSALRTVESEQGASVPLLIQQMRLLELSQGAAATLPAYGPHAERDPSNLLVRAHLAVALVRAGRRAESRRVLEDLVARPDAILSRRDWAIVLVSLAPAAAESEAAAVGADRAGRLGLGPLREALLPARQGFVLWPEATLCCAPAALTCGQLAHAMARFAEADDDFAFALDLSERTGARPFVVETRLAWARSLLARPGGDAEHARQLDRAARLEAGQLGMQAHPPAEAPK